MPEIVDRDEAGLKPPTRRTKLPAYPARRVFIHHGATRTPTTEREEFAAWVGYQAFHMGTRGWSDIAYNFGVGPVTGNTYIGRNWYNQGGATGSPEDAQTISVCAIGNFEKDEPSTELLNGIVRVIRRGIRKGHLIAPVTVDGHKDKPYSTSCPGKLLYRKLDYIRAAVDRPMDGSDDDDLNLTSITLEDRVVSLERRVEDLERG